MKAAERQRMFGKAGVKCYEADATWRTPATDYKLGKVGIAELRRSHYKRGVYVMEGVLGYPVFLVSSPIPVTTLYIRGNQWMVDDPLHWLGMKSIANASSGRVLVIGLGLGLLVHALGANQDIRHVTVVEQERDVISLIKPLLTGVSGGTDDRYWLKIVKADFWSLKSFDEYETIILDIWTTSEHSRGAAALQMQAALGLLKDNDYKGKTFIWGTRDPKLNPAIKPMSKESQRYLGLITEAM